MGQGDSIWLHASDNTDILIDGGPASAGPTVVAYLQNEGIDDIEVMVLTHAHADHVAGLIDVLRSTIPVRAVVYNGAPYSSATYQTFLAEMQADELTATPAQVGQAYAWGPLNTYVLNPQASLAGDQNEDSVVLLVVYGNVRFLLTGDIDSSTEQTILGGGTPVAAEVLKVAHHGSAYGSSATFLDAVGAELAVISVGADNPYGHPAEETLTRLRASGARILRTDQRGTVIVHTDGVRFDVSADYLIFLPLVRYDATPTPTPTSSPTPTPSRTPAPSPTPTPSRTPAPSPTPTPSRTPTPSPTSTPSRTPSPTPTEAPGTTGDINIVDIFYDGEGSTEPDEYVEIRNDDSKGIQLSGWTLRDEANHVFTFPSYLMQPNEVCRVYTNENHPEWCGFSYGSGAAIWNNTGDCAYLRDGTGTTVDTYCY